MASGTGIGEFYISLFVDAADGGLTVSNLVQGFGQLEIATIGEIALLWELGTMLARFTDAGIKASLGFEQFTMHTGLSAQALQHWQIVAEQSHASAQDVAGSAENLTKHLANLAVGIPDAALGSLQQLGISAFDASGRLKTAFEIFGEIRARLGVITQDAGQQERILAGLGISPNMRETFLLADALFNKRGALVPGMSGDQEKQFDHLRETMVQIELLARQIGINIASWTSPAVQKILDVIKSVDVLLLKGGAAWSEAFHRAFAAQEQAQKTGKPMEFKESVLGQILYGTEPSGGKEYRAQLQDLGLPPAPAPAAPTQVNIDKHDVYNIHDATDPQKVKEVIERHWDDTLKTKTINGFDQQLQAGY